MDNRSEISLREAEELINEVCLLPRFTYMPPPRNRDCNKCRSGRLSYLK